MFLVNRYQGDGGSSQGSNEKQNKLNLLLEKANKRKLEREKLEKESIKQEPIIEEKTHQEVEEVKNDQKIEIAIDKNINQKKSKKRNKKSGGEDYASKRMSTDKKWGDDDDDGKDDVKIELDIAANSLAMEANDVIDEKEYIEFETNSQRAKKEKPKRTQEDVWKQSYVKKTMPLWMKNATVISTDLNNDCALVDSMRLSDEMVMKLKKNGVFHFFPVQRRVIPMILSSGLTPAVHPGDLCVCAPTGSGKTLTYVIPIIESLKSCVRPRLRCLMLLPTRDLALQVHAVVLLYSEGTHINSAVCTGQTSFEDEQNQLVDISESNENEDAPSKIDILVCTPGRLVDHVSSTPGFTLKHLRFLVIDEADRLLNQSYHNWLSKVLENVYQTRSQDAGFRQLHSRFTAYSNQFVQIPLQKLVFSATLSQNPEKLMSLHLHCPRMLTAATNARFVTPRNLKETMITCSAQEKPLVLLHLLIKLQFKHVLCFTSSVEATHRLYLLLKHFGNISVAEYSSFLSQTKRNEMLLAFSNGDIDVLVCSDAMARGMDVEKVEKVICYDTPVYVKTYIHRVGRTARAGRTGEAYTILRKEEVRHFKAMVRKANKRKIHQMKIPPNDLDIYEDRVNNALGGLKLTLEVESGRAGKGVSTVQEYIKNNLLSQTGSTMKQLEHIEDTKIKQKREREKPKSQYGIIFDEEPNEQDVDQNEDQNDEDEDNIID